MSLSRNGNREKLVAAIEKKRAEYEDLQKNFEKIFGDNPMLKKSIDFVLQGTLTDTKVEYGGGIMGGFAGDDEYASLLGSEAFTYMMGIERVLAERAANGGVPGKLEQDMQKMGYPFELADMMKEDPAYKKLSENPDLEDLSQIVLSGNYGLLQAPKPEVKAEEPQKKPKEEPENNIEEQQKEEPQQQENQPVKEEVQQEQVEAPVPDGFLKEMTRLRERLNINSRAKETMKLMRVDFTKALEQLQRLGGNATKKDVREAMQSAMQDGEKYQKEKLVQKSSFSKTQLLRLKTINYMAGVNHLMEQGISSDAPEGKRFMMAVKLANAIFTADAKNKQKGLCSSKLVMHFAKTIEKSEQFKKFIEKNGKNLDNLSKKSLEFLKNYNNEVKKNFPDAKSTIPAMPKMEDLQQHKQAVGKK